MIFLINFKTLKKNNFGRLMLGRTLNLNPAHPHSRGSMPQIRDIFTVRRIFDKMPAENIDEKVDLTF